MPNSNEALLQFAEKGHFHQNYGKEPQICTQPERKSQAELKKQKKKKKQKEKRRNRKKAKQIICSCVEGGHINMEILKEVSVQYANYL